MPKAKTKTKGAKGAQHNTAGESSTASAQPPRSQKGKVGKPTFRLKYKNKNSHNDVKRDDNRGYYRLLQMFPRFPPIYLHRVYHECNKSFTRTIDNILYVKRYCAFLNKKRLESISPIPNVNAKREQQQQSNVGMPGTSVHVANENTGNSIIVPDHNEWAQSKCKTPELEAPRRTSTPDK